MTTRAPAMLINWCKFGKQIIFGFSILLIVGDIILNTNPLSDYNSFDGIVKSREDKLCTSGTSYHSTDTSIEEEMVTNTMVRKSLHLNDNHNTYVSLPMPSVYLKLVPIHKLM